jgi:PAS domain S-box-containing protein
LVQAALKVKAEKEQNRVAALLKNNPKGLMIEEVSKRLSLNRATAAKYLNAMVMSGRAEMRTLGPAKLFYLSNRLPLMNLMSLSSDLILVLDDEFFIQHVNETFLDYFHLSLEDLKGMRFDQSPLAADLPEIGEEHLATALEGTTLTLDLEIEAAAEPYYFKSRILPLVFEGGARGVGVILEDVTQVRRYQMELEERVRRRTIDLEETNRALEREIAEHRVTESQLASSRHFVEQIIETTPNLIYIFSLEPLRPTYANSNVTTILGYRAEELTDGAADVLSAIMHPDDFPAVVEHYAYFARTGNGEVREIEYRVRHASGHWVTLRCREVVFARDAAGAPIQVIGTAEDVTERRRAENAIRKANRQLLLLNSITRHDILNQLNVLAASLRLTSRTISNDAPSREHLAREERAVETIRRQITFTRDYQSIGAQPPRWQQVQDMITRVLIGIDREGIDIRAGDCPIEIYADLLIEKVFFNLIDNAIRHGGTIRTVRFSCQADDAGLLIICEDDGVGIPAEEKEQIFDRAYGKNSGYGLFLVREILGITGMSIRETGIVGEGARFEIAVPPGLFRHVSPGADPVPETT